MKLNKMLAAAAAGLALAIAGAPASAHAAEPAPDNVTPVFDHAITNIPGKSLVAVEVHYEPGEKSAAHRHEKSSFIMAYVVSGAIRSQVAGEPAKVYKAGQTWFENPGAHHLVSENASETEPATLLAVFVVNTDHGDLTTFDSSTTTNP